MVIIKKKNYYIIMSLKMIIFLIYLPKYRHFFNEEYSIIMDFFDKNGDIQFLYLTLQIKYVKFKKLMQFELKPILCYN